MAFQFRSLMETFVWKFSFDLNADVLEPCLSPLSKSVRPKVARQPAGNSYEIETPKERTNEGARRVRRDHLSRAKAAPERQAQQDCVLHVPLPRFSRLLRPAARCLRPSTAKPAQRRHHRYRHRQSETICQCRNHTSPSPRKCKKVGCRPLRTYRSLRHRNNRCYAYCQGLALERNCCL